MLEEAARRGLTFTHEELHPELIDTGPLWPTPYADNTFECAWRFVRNLRTWNEAEQEVQFLPDKEFLERNCYNWVNCRKKGATLYSEKCRRMVVSWEDRGLELWAMGLRRTDCLLCGENLAGAAKHVWRLKYLYEDLQWRQARGLLPHNDDWNLPPHHELQYEGERRLKMFGLANGSVTNYANGESDKLQGDGTAIITLEEFSTYRYGPTMLNQAQIITQGSANSIGGFVNVILNASANGPWQSVKKKLLSLDD